MRDGNQKITDLLGPYTPPPSDSSSPARSPLSDSSLPPSPSTTKLEVKEEVLFIVFGNGVGRFFKGLGIGQLLGVWLAFRVSEMLNLIKVILRCL